MKIDPFLSPCKKLKCKWINDLHIKPGTLKLLDENLGKTLEHRHRRKLTEQNRSNNEVSQYGHFIFDKGAENIQCKKNSLFNKWCWLNWQSASRRMKIDPFLSPCTKLKCKWIKDLHIKPGTLKLLEEKVGGWASGWHGALGASPGSPGSPGPVALDGLWSPRTAEQRARPHG